MSDLQLKTLKNASRIDVGARFIQGVHTYDLLRNPFYRHLFHYIPVQVPQGKMREEFIYDGKDEIYNKCAQSDLTRLALYYPYLPKSFQDSFNFDISKKFENLKGLTDFK